MDPLPASRSGDGPRWMPTASIEALRGRARVVAAVREFFAERDVLEVETPVLALHPSPELHLASLHTRWTPPAGAPRSLYLQTSPEFAMKRLLAAGSGPIFQIGRAFRDGERGRAHNPEFSLLEWYRPGFDHHRLMDEVDELLAALFRLPAARRVRFAALFAERTGLDPFVATTAELERVCASAGLRDAGAERSARIDFLFESQVRPYLGSGAVMVHDFPPDQASLARVSESDPPTAERFELYVDTIEVANGYRELTDCEEQRSRFERDLDARARAGLARPELDERLLAALASGLPECSGVALGIDRLLMAAWRRPSIDEVIAFPVERA